MTNVLLCHWSERPVRHHGDSPGLPSEMSAVTTLTSPSATLVPMLTSLRESMTTYTVQVSHEPTTKGGRLSFQALLTPPVSPADAVTLKPRPCPRLRFIQDCRRCVQRSLCRWSPRKDTSFSWSASASSSVLNLCSPQTTVAEASYPANHRRMSRREPVGRG